MIMRTSLISLITLMALAIGMQGCSNSPEDKAMDRGQEIWFEEKMHDYGVIEQNGDGTWAFVFKNLGEKPFVINRVRSTCGCTVPEWPREPIEPGSSGEIKVIYDTKRTGTFLKSVIVYSTAANSPVKLQIKGKVVAPEAIE